ncbi:unnamed protein product [Rotaria socialis]|nr:unnamed protein product [Rotaria socialis]
MDCLGGTDERTFCHLSYPSDENRRYRCWNDTKCADYSQRCTRCKPFHDVNVFCGKPTNAIRDISEYFQLMQDFYLVVKLPFSPQSSRPFPTRLTSPSVNKPIQNQTFQAKQLKNIDRLDSKQAWFCHQGILIYYGKK